VFSRNLRLRDRLTQLEAKLVPTGRMFVFISFGVEDLPYAEQLAAFKAEKGVGPHDTLVEVTLTFDA
jgi:hypothetical protein